jgi:O-acetyl-ADP-ribose deacetylase (regulator of RNase III)/uncharacterized protein YwgA
MPRIRALIGDVLASRAQTLVNPVNCVGVMGKGVALEFKKRFPAMFQDYVRLCERKEVRLGEPYLYRDLTGVQIVNFPTKGHWRSASRLEDIERGLDHLAAHVDGWDITSLAVPPLGCGNGGLAWADVGPLIYRKLKSLPIDVEIYAPYGTPKSELAEQFLAAPTQSTFLDRGRRSRKLNAEWVTLMEVLRGLTAQQFANPVGRTTFQKISYVVTEMGVQTGFDFGKGSYGPFSEDVKAALHDLANRNWVQEKQLGRMLALQTAPQYEIDRAKYTDVIATHQRKIDKVVDLFSRIKNTEQAEEIVTTLYAIRELKSKNSIQPITEQQVSDVILSWKRSWNNPEKKESIAAAIRNLLLLNWVRVELSESFDEAAESVH